MRFHSILLRHPVVSLALLATLFFGRASNSPKGDWASVLGLTDVTTATDDDYQTRQFSTGTAIEQVLRADGNYQFNIIDWDGDGIPDLVAIKTRGANDTNTASGRTELSVLSGASLYQQVIYSTGTAGTAIGQVTRADQNFQFLMADWAHSGRPDLIAIKTRGAGDTDTGTGQTELFVVSAASDYQTVIYSKGTAIEQVFRADQNFQFLMADWEHSGRPDLIAIKTRGAGDTDTGTRKTELFVISASSDYQNKVYSQGTAIEQVARGDKNFQFAVTEWEHSGRPDLIAIKTRGAGDTDTGTRQTELFVVPGAADYQQKVYSTGTSIEQVARGDQNFQFLVLNTYLFALKTRGANDTDTGTGKTELFVLGPRIGDWGNRTQTPANFSSSSSRVVFVPFFYWYVGCNWDEQRHHPPYARAAFDWHSNDYYFNEFRNMQNLGIDVAAPVYWGTPQSTDDAWPDGGLVKMSQVRDSMLSQGYSPPSIAMFYDTSTIGLNNIDLRTPSGKDWFYQTIKKFFTKVPRRHWTMIDGKPVVILFWETQVRHYDPATGKFDGQTLTDGQTLAYARGKFRDDFGLNLYIMRDGPAARMWFTNPSSENPEVRGGNIDVWAGVTYVNPQLSLNADSGNYNDVLATFLTSSEIRTNVGNNPRTFFAKLYRELLAREASGPEIDDWINVLGSVGSDWRAATLIFLTQRETRQTFVARLFKRILPSRHAVPISVLKADAGVNAWVDALQSGASVAAVMGGILGSSEAWGDIAAADTDTWLEAALTHTLARCFRYEAAPQFDSTDRNFWRGVLASQGRTQTATILATSGEARRNIVAAWYMDHLGRANFGEADTETVYADSQCPSFTPVMGFQPGFDNLTASQTDCSRACNRNPRQGCVPRPHGVIDRQGGQFYSHSWNAAIRRRAPGSEFVFVTSWNELWEESDIMTDATYRSLTTNFTGQMHRK